MDDITQTIQHFWNTHPCGDTLVESLKEDYEAFFQRYDAMRYHKEAHILRCLDAIQFEGKRVLEIGLGQGADSEQIIRRGAIWSGVDLSPESIKRVHTRLLLRGLLFERLEYASALSLPFPDNHFDIVFSHGVLHHIPDILSAQAEIHRVLKPGGRLVAMLYAKRSFNYFVAISVVRRLALLFLYTFRVKGKGIVGCHLANARSLGLWKYLKMPTFIHANTDGPSNPYSKVYDLLEVERDFPAFEIEKSHQEYMHAPPLPISRLSSLAGLLGWHLWVHLISRSKRDANLL